MKRTATAVWHGTGKEGKGSLTTQSTTLNKTQYSWTSRFEEGIGTNPEELLAAAHAGCFTMKLTFLVGGAGFTPEQLETKCTIHMDNGSIDASHLVVTGKVAGITEEKFAELVDEAKANCMVTKLFTATTTVEHTLNGEDKLPM